MKQNDTYDFPFVEWSYMQILEECKFQIRAFSKEMEYGSSAAESERAFHDTSDKMSLNSPTMSRF